MRAGPLLLETHLSDYRPLGALGEPVYLSHRKLVAAIEARGSAECARYLARPEIDERQKKVAWHAPCEGAVRGWGELTEEERGRLAPRLEAIRDGFRGLLATLGDGTEAGRSREAFALMLRQALYAPHMQHLYAVGDQPVLAVWGL